MTDTRTHREALARAFFTMRPAKALRRYPELSDAYTAFELLVDEVKNADALCADVQAIVAEDLKIWIAQQLRHGAAVAADEPTRESMRWFTAHYLSKPADGADWRGSAKLALLIGAFGNSNFTAEVAGGLRGLRCSAFLRDLYDLCVKLFFA